MLHFLNDGVRTAIIVILPFIAIELSLSLGQVGFLGSSQPLVAAALSLPAGFLTGRFGGIKLIFSLLLVYSIGIFAAAFSQNQIILFGAYLLAAFGFGMFHTVGFSLVAHQSESKNIGKNLGSFTAIGEIGRVAIPPVALFLATTIGWRQTLIFMSIIGVVAYFFNLYFQNKNDKKLTEIKTKQNHKEFLKDIYFIFRNKKAFLVSMSAILDTAASSPQQVFLPFLLISKGIDIASLSLVMGGFFVGSLLGKSILGHGTDMFGHLKIFIFSELSMALTLILIAQSNSFIMLIILSTLLGGFTKGTSPVVQAMFSELAKKEHYHKIFAFGELMIAIGAVISINLLGVIAEKTNISIVFYSGAILATLAVLPIIYLNKTNKLINPKQEALLS